MNTSKEASIRSSLTPSSRAPAFQKTRLSEEVSLLTVKLSAWKLPHPVLLILWFMCPQLSSNVPSMPLVHAKPPPAKATRNKKGKTKPVAKAGAKRPTEQTTLTHMDVENTVDLQSIDKGQ